LNCIVLEFWHDRAPHTDLTDHKKFSWLQHILLAEEVRKLKFSISDSTVKPNHSDIIIHRINYFRNTSTVVCDIKNVKITMTIYVKILINEFQ